MSGQDSKVQNLRKKLQNVFNRKEQANTILNH